MMQSTNDNPSTNMKTRHPKTLRELIILGTGVHAAEMAEMVQRINAVRPTWNFLGHIQAQDFVPGETFNDQPILGTFEAVGRYPAAGLVPDNGFPRALITVPRERLTSLVDPTAVVSPSATIGAGCVIYPHCFVGYKAKIGDFSFILSGAIINHDDVLEERVIVASGVALAGYVHIEAGCYLGQACTIRQTLRIGAGSLVGMGAVVVKDVPPNSIMVGNPARKLKDRETP